MSNRPIDGLSVNKMLGHMRPTLAAIQHSIAELRASVVRHFPVQQMPDRGEIISHECEECWRVQDDFAGRRWLDVPHDTIDFHYDSLPLFTPTAHHYYLPAFLLRSLQPEGDMWGTMLDFVIYDLCPDQEDWWRSRFEVFSPDQMRVVGLWLALVLEHPESFDGDDVVGRRGYAQYWKDHVA